MPRFVSVYYNCISHYLYVCPDLSEDEIFILERHQDITGQQLNIDQFMGKYISDKYRNIRKPILIGKKLSFGFALEANLFDESFDRGILEKNIPIIRQAIEIMEEHICECCPYPIEDHSNGILEESPNKEAQKSRELKYLSNFPLCTLHGEYQLRNNVYETHYQEFTLTQNLVRQLMD